jgi:hypothetical protein
LGEWVTDYIAKTFIRLSLAVDCGARAFNALYIAKTPP